MEERSLLHQTNQLPNTQKGITGHLYVKMEVGEVPPNNCQGEQKWNPSSGLWKDLNASLQQSLVEPPWSSFGGIKACPALATHGCKGSWHSVLRGACNKLGGGALLGLEHFSKDGGRDMSREAGSQFWFFSVVTYRELESKHILTQAGGWAGQVGGSHSLGAEDCRNGTKSCLWPVPYTSRRRRHPFSHFSPADAMQN